MPSFAHPAAMLEQSNPRGLNMPDVTVETLAASLLQHELENRGLSRPIEKDAAVAHQFQRLKTALEHGRIDELTHEPTRHQVVSVLAALGPARLLEIMELFEGSGRHPHRRTLSALLPENADETTQNLRSAISELYRAVLAVRIFSGKRTKSLLTIGQSQSKGLT